MKDNTTPSQVMDFGWAIAPLSVDSFLSDTFEKQHVVIARDTPDYYADLLSITDIDRVMTQQILPSEELNLVSMGKPIPEADYTTDAGFIDPVRTAQQFTEGATIVLPGLHRRIPQLSAFCRSLETVFGCDLQTNIYLTPDNAQGFKTHYDSHDVIVLQTHGSKTWRIYESPMELPLRTQAFSPEGFEAGKQIDEFVLHAGDMAYVPRGVVHDAIATDEISLHITTGLLATRWVDLLLDAVSDLAHDDPAFRAAVPPGLAGNAAVQDAARQTFRDLLRRAADGVDPDRALKGYTDAFASRRVPVVPGQLIQRLTADAIEPGARVRPRPDLIHEVYPRDGEEGAEIVLSVYGTEIAFPAVAEAPLRDVLTRDVSTVGDLAGEIDEAGQAVLVRRLVREGVLELIG